MLAFRIEAGVLSQRAAKAGDIRVVADQVAVAVHDRIDSANELGLRVEPVEQRDDGLFVRDGDVRAQHLVSAQGVDAALQLLRLGWPGFVPGVDAGRVEGGLEDRRAGGVR